MAPGCSDCFNVEISLLLIQSRFWIPVNAAGDETAVGDEKNVEGTIWYVYWIARFIHSFGCLFRHSLDCSQLW